MKDKKSAIEKLEYFKKMLKSKLWLIFQDFYTNWDKNLEK